MRHDFSGAWRGKHRGVFTAQEYHFGDFTLDCSRYRLERGGDQLRLEKLPMDLLILLVERRGELVSRHEIAERLWGKDVFVDIDHGINVAIRKIRAALRDNSEKPRFIETVVGRGYRFAATVTSNGDASLELQSVHSGSQAVSTPNDVRITPSQKRIISVRAAVFAAAAVLAALAVTVVLNRGWWRTNRTPITSLAVLPLKNLSGDPAENYLADGMTEELIGRLAQVPGLRVISRTSVMRLRETQLSLPDIAKTLNVDAVLEGSVIREGNQIRIHAQLIRAATDEHIWAEEYQREYQSVLALEEDVSRTIAERVEASIAPGQRLALAPDRQVNPEAHEDYLKGRYYFNQRTDEALNRSLSYFKQSIAIDPTYALAYSGLADDYALIGFRGAVPSRESLTQAKAAALKAIELDDKLAAAHASLAFIAETHEWDWTTAEREYKRALELNPGDARAHHWYSGYLVYRGRFDQGIAEEKRARDLDPLSLPINNALAGRLLVAGRYDEATNQVEKALELDPRFPPAHQTLGWVYLNRGKPKDAIREFQNAVELSGSDNIDFMLDLGFGYAMAGDHDQARTILDKLMSLYRQGLAPSGSIGILYGAMGEKDQAFRWLNRACDERDPELTYIKVPGRRFEPLRNDSRFQQLVARVGVPN
jgi:TolB-like protein/DNA-binding winged helix-turn-helix (wHTH) protein/Flp pilus assembly protein TadD